jgi:hypothetical protein
MLPADARGRVGCRRHTHVAGARLRQLVDIYHKLEYSIAPRFYDDRAGWVTLMRYCIAMNGATFNTHRMVHQCLLHAYAPSLASNIAKVLSAEIPGLGA